MIAHTLAPVRVKRVLLPTDFSSCAERALSYALPICAACQAQMFILHVLPPESPVRPQTVEDFLPHRFDFNRHQAEKHLRSLENSSALAKVEHSILLLNGDLRNLVESCIQRRDIDLVVLGTHGRGGLKKLFLGSVAEGVSREAPCAVLIVGPHAPSASSGFTFRHILYATEYSTGSLTALRYALSLAQQCGADLTLLHVCGFLEGGPFVDNETVMQRERERLKALLPESLQLPSPPKLVARMGIITETILTAAREGNADLIVMGARPAHSLAAATHSPWSVEHQIVCHAACPVLTVRG
jgi:nucleotide-binding universal stress UspA family protein